MKWQARFPFLRNLLPVLPFPLGQAKPFLRTYLRRGRIQSLRSAGGAETARFRMQAPAGKP
jgi:hypothetical protein